MTKYLVFNNSRTSGKLNVPGSPEDIACDIARVMENEGNSKNWFISYPAESSEATFATIQQGPRYSLELDNAKINTWRNDVEPLLNKINGVHTIVDCSYSNITQAVNDLERSIKASALFHDLDLLSEMGIDYGFEAISRPNGHEFSDRIMDIFNVAYLKSI